MSEKGNDSVMDMKEVYLKHTNAFISEYEHCLRIAGEIDRELRTLSLYIFRDGKEQVTFKDISYHSIPVKDKKGEGILKSIYVSNLRVDFDCLLKDKIISFLKDEGEVRGKYKCGLSYLWEFVFNDVKVITNGYVDLLEYAVKSHLQLELLPLFASSYGEQFIKSLSYDLGNGLVRKYVINTCAKRFSEMMTIERVLSPMEIDFLSVLLLSYRNDDNGGKKLISELNELEMKYLLAYDNEADADDEILNEE